MQSKARGFSAERQDAGTSDAPAAQGPRMEFETYLPLADRPSTKIHKPVSTLPPQTSAVLICPVFANVARTLISHCLMIGKHP